MTVQVPPSGERSNHQRGGELRAELVDQPAYGMDDAVVTKQDEQRVAISSVSSTYVQERMLEQAELRPWMTVLEIGSGGLNAALITDVIGPDDRPPRG